MKYVLRTQLTICEKIFCENSQRILAVNYLRKKICIVDVWLVSKYASEIFLHCLYLKRSLFIIKSSSFVSQLLMSILNSVVLVLLRDPRVSCHYANVPSWVQMFSCGFFVGPKFFLVCISWSKIFCRKYFVSPKFFVVGISRIQNFFSQVFRRSNFFLLGIFVVRKVLLKGIFCAKNFFSWKIRRNLWEGKKNK